MHFSRRDFLAAAAVVAPMGRAWGGTPPAPTPSCAQCVLPESRDGYRKALAGREQPRNLAVVPAAAGWDPSLVEQVRNGQWVLFESAAGFGDAFSFEEQRVGLAKAFGLIMENPRAPWLEHSRPPYVQLRWPAPALVREFSSVVAVRGGETIGRFGDLTVAVLRRAGTGAFLFLGSPLGPALWSDDVGAHAWLTSVLAAAARRPA